MNSIVDRGFSLVFFSIGLAFIIGSRGYVSTSYGSQVGSNVFPTMLGIIAILLSIKLFFETFKYPKEENTSEKQSLDYKKFFIFVLLTLCYCLLLRPLGYVISTFLFLLIGFQIVQRGKVWVSFVISLLISVLVYYVYVEILDGTLPKFPEFLGFLN
ncbi:tripartite tricarboxylate transporter TctB family protein [Ureibacillus composti]